MTYDTCGKLKRAILLYALVNYIYVVLFSYLGKVRLTFTIIDSSVLASVSKTVFKTASCLFETTV